MKRAGDWEGRLRNASKRQATGASKRSAVEVAAPLPPPKTTARKSVREAQNGASVNEVSEAATEPSQDIFESTVSKTVDSDEVLTELSGAIIEPRGSSSPSPLPSSSSIASFTSTPSVTENQIRYYRLRANHLVNSDLRGPAGLSTIAAALFGIQAQEPVSAFASCWQRMWGGARVHDDGAKQQADPTKKKSSGDDEQHRITLSQLSTWFLSSTGLIRIWGQRATLHMYDRNDWPLICSAVGDFVTAGRVASVKAGRVTGKDAAAELARARDTFRGVLASGQTVSATDIAALGFNPKLTYSILMCATVAGQGGRIDVGGIGTASVLAPRSVIAPEAECPWREVDKADALVEAARRFFKTYGPALETDFRYFMTLTAGPSRQAVETLIASRELTAVTISTRPSPTKLKKKPDIYYISTAALPTLLAPIPPLTQWPVRLLYRFDPLLLAHADKSFWIPAHHKSKVWTPNGIILPTVLVEGRVTATWKFSKEKDETTRFVVSRLPEEEEYGSDTKRELERQGRGFAEFMGLKFGDIAFNKH
ncbi:hypothetical protein PhCBS80983_g03902 [Powellomyces hirtus]|uniref:Winged helix DNA-binding domain-containing protein n=1 Tax=Powellomyces hirtus TaxID=109895 RepID=A0A507E0T0_9FUNG|nr:hypothetical protein PhCBS80983_g03902 [Powellomyces hirtus]